MSRIAIKVGSNVLTRQDGSLDVTRMSSLVDQIVRIRRAGHEVILISSGAVACGRSMVQTGSRLDGVEQRQLFSAVGQVRLMTLYYNLFQDYGVPVGQVLTMKESFSTRREYLNQRACMEVMLQNKVVPIVNENDTVSVTELMFTDNDELSGLVASMMDASALVILSNVDGVFTGSPADPGSRLIREIGPRDDISSFITNARSGFGRGGMLTKCSVARRAADEGIRVLVANGKRNGILCDLILGNADVPHTEFKADRGAVSSVKKWLAHSSGFAKGTVSIDDKALARLRESVAASLLLVGVTEIKGDFEEGDLINITDRNGNLAAVGKSSYGSEEAAKLIGAHDKKPLVSCDYLYMYEQ